MPRSHWLLSVLEDLRAYAVEHELADLEHHLTKTFEVAQAELATGPVCGESGGREGNRD